MNNPSVRVVVVLSVLAGLVFWPSLRLLAHDDSALVDHLLTFDTADVVTKVELADPQRLILWALENPDGIHVPFLDYGIVPKGFKQVVPESVPPRALKPGESLRVTVAVQGQDYASIWTHADKSNKFRHGMRVSGHGCKSPGCDEMFWYWSGKGKLSVAPSEAGSN